MCNCDEEFSPIALSRELSALSLDGVSLNFFDVTDSTNRQARLALESGSIGEGTALFIADKQTKGRGRFDRRFDSDSGVGIYMSLVTSVSDWFSDGALLTVLAAVAAAEAVEELSGARVDIKWVNDLYISGKKLAGILCEGIVSPETSRLERAIIGIGVNVYKRDFGKELSEIATDIESAAKKRISRARLSAKITKNILDGIASYKKEELIEKYKARSFLSGKRVKVTRGNESYFATVEDVNLHAELVVKKDDGTLEALSSGEVSVIAEK